MIKVGSPSLVFSEQIRLSLDTVSLVTSPSPPHPPTPYTSKTKISSSQSLPISLLSFSSLPSFPQALHLQWSLPSGLDTSENGGPEHIHRVLHYYLSTAKMLGVGVVVCTFGGDTGIDAGGIGGCCVYILGETLIF